MRRAGVSPFGGRANEDPASRPGGVWVAVVTRARRVRTLVVVKNRLVILAVVLALLVLAALGLVLGRGD